MKIQFLSFIFLVSLITSCSGGEEETKKDSETKKEKFTFCQCIDLMKERELDLESAENRAEMIEKWMPKTAMCNEIMQAKAKTYDEELANCK